mmetsp:Transcript_890/g.1375  ORF Transcript_890/g.1375 Transcript_890/m.1375 type:complete len:81 (-) Transcript_890:403-645(-)
MLVEHATVIQQCVHKTGSAKHNGNHVDLKQCPKKVTGLLRLKKQEPCAQPNVDVPDDLISNPCWPITFPKGESSLEIEHS